MTFLLSAVFLATNWFTFIWAVNSNHVVEASMGYFINPLLNVLLGTLLLRERLGRLQGIAVGLAFAGVTYMACSYGRVPWIALLLAFTFAGYGLLRKVGKLESFAGLGLETLYLGPIALAYVVYLALAGESAL